MIAQVTRKHCEAWTIEGHQGHDTASGKTIGVCSAVAPPADEHESGEDLTPSRSANSFAWSPLSSDRLAAIVATRSRWRAPYLGDPGRQHVTEGEHPEAHVVTIAGAQDGSDGPLVESRRCVHVAPNPLILVKRTPGLLPWFLSATARRRSWSARFRPIGARLVRSGRA